MLRRAFGVTLAVAALAFGPGCDLLPDDGSGLDDFTECTGGPVNLTVPASVFCSVERISATISAADMSTIEVAIDRAHPTVTLQIPSGPDRHLVVRVYTVENPGDPYYTSPTVTFCVPDGQPVSVSVDVTLKNHAPRVGGIVPNDVTLPAGVPVMLAVEADDPDGCDRVKSYRWTTGYGSIAVRSALAARASGTAVWTPQCPGGQSCDATVDVTVEDERGGRTTKHGTYRITGAAGAPANRPPTVSLSATRPNQMFCSFALAATASDPDGDPLTYAWSRVAPASAASFTPGGSTATWSDPSTAGVCMYNDTVQVTVTDSHGASATAQITLPTAPVNNPPVVTLSTVRTNFGSGCSVTITANASDPDFDPLTYSWSRLGSVSAASFMSGGSVASWADLAGCQLTDTVQVTVADSHGASATAQTAVP